jgi:putative ABC transport system permease protein
MAIVDADNNIFNSDKNAGKRDLMINTMDGNLTNPEFEKSIRTIKGLKNICFISSISAGLWLTSDMQSDELLAIGGLNRVAASGKYEVYQQENKFRIITFLTALDDESFNNYCKQIGTDPSLFYNAKSPKTIVINEQRDDINSDRRNDIPIKFLNLNVGDKLKCEEKVFDEDTSKYTFQTEVGYLTNQIPSFSTLNNKFQLVQIMPRSTYLKIVNNFSNEKRKMNAQHVSAVAVAQSDDQIQSVADKMEAICNKWYGSGDYYIWSILETRKVNASAMLVTRVIVMFISGFLALIGISNVFSTVSGNLKQRQKEFAILRSVGLQPKGIRRMLTMEALFFGLIPILLSIPVNILLIGIFLKIKMIYFSEFLPYMPILPIIVFGIVILLSILLAYTLGGKKISKTAIVDVLKDEAV